MKVEVDMGNGESYVQKVVEGGTSILLLDGYRIDRNHKKIGHS